MSNLKGIANRLKGLEKASGVNERENLIREVCEIIKAHQVINPAFYQRQVWPLCELSLAEVRSLGKGEKVLEDFKPRWKITLEDFWNRRQEWREANYLREIAEFNRTNGDPYQEWELNYGKSNLSSPLKGDGEAENGNGKLQ
ncbi:MAG TPA: hypothetical protein PKC29_02005 [Thermodesulfobacteriota bacterium]|nr:hypothetical protein [Thermodesulfobacteriota bacterium]